MKLKNLISKMSRKKRILAALGLLAGTAGIAAGGYGIAQAVVADDGFNGEFSDMYATMANDKKHQGVVFHRTKDDTVASIKAPDFNKYHGSYLKNKDGSLMYKFGTKKPSDYEFVNVFYSQYGTYTDSDGNTHHIGVLEQVYRNNKDAQGVIFSPKNLGVCVYLTADKDHDWIGSVNTRIVFYETKKGKSKSTNFSDYKEYTHFKAPIYVKDIDVGQWFKLNGKGNRDNTAVYTKDEPTSKDSRNSSHMDVKSSEGYAPRVAYSGHYYYGAGRSINNWTTADSVGSNDARGQVGILLTANTSKLSGTFGVTNGKTYESDGKGHYVNDPNDPDHNKVVKNGIRISNGHVFPSLLDYYKHMAGSGDGYSFDDYQGSLSGFTKMSSILKENLQTISYTGNYLGFKLDDGDSPNPKTTPEKEVQTADMKTPGTTTEKTAANTKENDSFTYRLNVNTGYRGGLKGYKPKYTELTTTDNMYGVRRTSDKIKITSKYKGKDEDVTNLFDIDDKDVDKYRTRVTITLKSNVDKANPRLYNTKVTATIPVKADKKMLVNCAKDSNATHGRVKLIYRKWEKFTITKTYAVQNMSKVKYEWDKIKGEYELYSNITYTHVTITEPRIPKTALSVHKEVYANGDYSTNIDKNVNKSANTIYNNNDRITYKITARFKSDLIYDTDKEDGDREHLYFADFTMTDQIKDMQGLSINYSKLDSDNKKDVVNIKADIKNDKLTFSGAFRSHDADVEHTVTIYVTGRPKATQDLKNIYNTAHVDYHTKREGDNGYYDKNTFTKKEGAYPDSNTTWYQARKLTPPQLHKTAKEVTKSGDSTDVTATTTTFNRVFDYQVTASSNRIGGTKDGKIHITDNDLDSRYQILSVSVTNQTDNKGVAYYKANGNSNNYSKDGLTVSGNKISYVGPAYADRGTQYLMTIRVKYVGHQVITERFAKTNNTAYGWLTSEYENPGKNKASYTVNVVPEDPNIIKTVQSIDNGSSTQIMNANSTHTVHYRYDMQVGNKHDMVGFKMTDTLPENMELLPGLKLSVTYQDGYDGQQSTSELNQNDWKISYQDRKLELDLIKNAAKYTYATIHVDYQASVADHADWSDYATRKANNESEVTDGKGALLPGYIMVPNTVVPRFNDGHTLESTAYVREQRKELEVKQTITQDNTNYTTSQDKSHYLPKTRSDRTAVTTRLEIQMPNYVKISSFSASSTPDRAKMDKGNTHYESFKLVNSDNPDLTNSSLGLPSNKQEMSGKQYYYYSKYSPKTKYYENYAKLDKMWDKFNGQATLNGEVKHANDVKIHLPNIYSYKDITGVITYPNDKTAKIVVYGQVTGLAVDGDHPTNFALERKAYDEPNTVTGQIRSSGGYVSPWNQINLVNGLKTGQTGLTTQTYNDIDVTNLTGGSNFFSQTRSYKSASTLTEKLGHSVVLTSDNTGDDYKIGGNKYKSLTDTTIGTDPKRVIVTGQENKDVFGDDTDNRNQTLIDIRKTVTNGYTVPKEKELQTPGKEETTPHEYVTYYDINKGENYVRNYEEGYMFVGPDEVSAKAGYGLRDAHTLYTWTYDDKTDYDINAKSEDGIFSSTYAKSANNDKLNYDEKTLSNSDYAKVFNAANIGPESKDGYNVKTTFSKANASYSEVIGLKDADASDKALIDKNEKIVATVPTYHLRRFDLKYAHRHLLQGLQTLKNNGTDGGYANYIRDYDFNKDTKLTYRSKTFGTLAKMKVNANEILHIYGHRSLTKRGAAISNKRDEIVLNGSMSGHTAANTNGDLKNFLEDNTYHK